MPSPITNTGLVSILQEVTFRSYADILDKRRTKAVSDNILLRELRMLNPNATFRDLDNEFKRDIATSSAQLLSFLNRAGFIIVPKPE